MDFDEILKDSVRMCEFVNKAIAEGYTDSRYWVVQYKAYMAGERGPNMHDFTLVNLS